MLRLLLAGSFVALGPPFPSAATVPHTYLTSANSASLPSAPVRDTTVSVSRDGRLVVEDFGGRLIVEAWERLEVQVRSGRIGDRSLDVDVNSGPGGVRITGRPGRRDGGGGTLRVAVPIWLEVDVDGPAVHTRIVGTRAAVTVRTLRGEVELQDVGGRVDVRTVDGQITAERVSGEVELHSSEEDVDVRGATGSLTAESLDGDVVLRDIAADAVQAGSMDGDVRFRGIVPADARVELTTHDGDLRVELDGQVNADVTVQTFDGELVTDIPATLSSFRGGENMTFTLGEGGAELRLQAFDGDIEIVRGSP